MSARFIGFIVGDRLIATQMLLGPLVVGSPINGNGVLAGTTVTFDISGHGDAGAYKIFPPQTVAPTTMSTDAPLPNPRRTLVSPAPIRMLS